MNTLAIVDYGMGNLGSVINAFARLGVACEISNDRKCLQSAAGIVLPGVGAFSAAMQNLRQRDLDKVLTELVLEWKKPFLGICLGMQLLATDSTEQGLAAGLGWIEGHVVRLEPESHFPVPHVGWNEIQFDSGKRIFERLSTAPHFYFDHSYHLQCAQEWVTATCNYGGQWVAAVQKDNIHAVQFHPEKSQRNGLRMLRNFTRYVESRCNA